MEGWTVLNIWIYSAHFFLARIHHCHRQNSSSEESKWYYLKIWEFVPCFGKRPHLPPSIPQCTSTGCIWSPSHEPKAWCQKSSMSEGPMGGTWGPSKSGPNGTPVTGVKRLWKVGIIQPTLILDLACDVSILGLRIKQLDLPWICFLAYLKD